MLKNLLARYRAIPTPARASLWFVVCNAVQNGCKFLSMPFLVRLLTTEQYGVYSVFLSWTSILSIFVTLNLHAGVCNNAMLKYPDRRSEYISASQGLAISSTAIVFAVYLPFSRFVDRAVFGLEHRLVLLMFLQLLFTEGFQLWATRQRYEYRYISLLISTAILSAAYLLLPLAAALVTAPALRLDAVIDSGVAVQILFGAGFILYNFVRGRHFFVWEFWRYALLFNIPLVPHYLSNVVLGQADRVMIKRYIGSSEAGIYSLVYTVSIAVNLITSAINSAIIPYTYEKLEKHTYTRLRSVTNVLLLLVGGMVVFLSVLAPEIIRIVATEEYYDAIRLVPIIAISVYFTFLYGLFGNVEFYFGANRFIAVASTLAAGANVILNYLLLPKFGYYAAGYTTLFCYVLLSLAHYIFMRIICKQQNRDERVYDGKEILLISVGVITLAAGVAFTYEFAALRYLLAMALLAACVWKRKAWMTLISGIKEDKTGGRNEA